MDYGHHRRTPPTYHTYISALPYAPTPAKVAVYYPVEPPDMHSSAGAGAGASAGGGTEVEVHGYIREAVLDCVKNKVNHVYDIHLHTYTHTTP